MTLMRLSDHSLLVPNRLDILCSQYTLSLSSPHLNPGVPPTDIISLAILSSRGCPFFKTAQIRVPSEAHSPKFLETIILLNDHGTLLLKLIPFGYIASPPFFMSVTNIRMGTD